MEVKLLAMHTEETLGTERLLEKLTDALSKKHALGTATFVQTDNIRSLFAAFADAIQSAEVIALAFDPKFYVRVRHKLVAALGLTERANAQVAARIRESGYDISGELLGEQAAYPENARIFLSADGLYSAFVLQKGRQTIYFFPLCAARLDGILQEAFQPELPKAFGALAPQTETEPDEPVIPLREQLAKTVRALSETAVKIGVDGSKNAEVLKALGKEIPEFETVFSFTPRVEDKGEFNPADYTAQMAKAAREFANADLGACISDIYKEQTEEYILVAAAGETAATVRKLYREENESEEDFIAFAANELAGLLSEAAESEILKETDGKNGFWSSAFGKGLLAVILICLLVSAFVLAYFVMKDGEQSSLLSAAKGISDYGCNILFTI